MMPEKDMVYREKIEELAYLKKERDAVILAHNYQLPEIQDVADYVGDSLDLSRRAAENDAAVIVLCGVHFMAESAKMLAPEKKVLLPEKLAGCPLADTINVTQLRAFKEQNSGLPVVTYINSSAAVKAESTVCCTSTNAVKVVNGLPEDKILFIPDRNLARHVAAKTDKEIIPWDGYCITHERVTAADVARAKEAHPHAVIMVHPECSQEVTEIADTVLSTGDMLKFAAASEKNSFVVGTEMGLIYRLQKENPGKEFYLLSPGLICPNMKYTTLDKVINALKNMETEINVPEDIREAAAATLQKMLELSR